MLCRQADDLGDDGILEGVGKSDRYLPRDERHDGEFGRSRSLMRSAETTSAERSRAEAWKWLSIGVFGRMTG
jgi:hypothetical protein